MKVHCDYCGKEFSRSPSKIQRYKYTYCSRECSAKAQIRPGKVNCAFCGTEIIKQPSQIKEGSLHFCDFECLGKYRSDKIATQCVFCGKEFKRKRSRAERSQYDFCSFECRVNWQRTLAGQEFLSRRAQEFRPPKVLVYCDQCGQPLKRTLWQTEKFNHYFCDWECYSQWHRYGKYEAYYGPDWDEQRARAVERDNFACRVCGVSQEELGCSLHVHHLIPFQRFGPRRHEIANSLANLCSLCPSHHMKLEYLTLEEQLERIHF